LSARFYCEHILPRAGACLAALKAGSTSIMAMPEDQF
jgi:hypothetical protein